MDRKLTPTAAATLLLGALGLPLGSQAAPADPSAVAILVQSEGEVGLKAPLAKGKAQPIPALVKLHAGETLVLGKDAQARIVYFANGRQESWKGSGQVEIDEQAGKSKSLQAAVEQVPPVVAGQLKQTPSASQQGRSAMIVTRAMPQLAKLQKLQDEYKALKQDNPEAVLPEVFYLNGLLELREYGVAKTVLDDLKGKPAYQSVVELYGPLLGQ